MNWRINGNYVEFIDKDGNIALTREFFGYINKGSCEFNNYMVPNFLICDGEKLLEDCDGNLFVIGKDGKSLN